MEYYSSHINQLIQQLSSLPGIGAKSAQRLAFHIINMPKDQVNQLTSVITQAREKVQYCKCCCTLTAGRSVLSVPIPGETFHYYGGGYQGWRPTRRQAGLRVSIMSFMEQFPLCWGLAQMIFG